MAPLIILMQALFASSFSVGKVLLEYAPPILIVGVRMTIAGIILLAYEYLWLKKHIHIKKRQLWLYTQIIILGIYAAYIFRFLGLKYLTSSKTSFLFNALPFFTALYSYLLLNERMTKKQWVGLVIGFIGLIPILISSSTAEAQLGEFFFISWPEISILMAVALQSYSWVVVKKLVKEGEHSPSLVNGITMFSGGILALISSPFIETSPTITNPLIFSGWLAYVVIVSNIICYNMYGYLLKHHTATFISFSGFIVPLFAALYGWGLLGEVITWHFYLSACIVLIGLYLFYQDELASTPTYLP